MGTINFMIDNEITRLYKYIYIYSYYLQLVCAIRFLGEN